jgi:hypothetical protein
MTEHRWIQTSHEDELRHLLFIVGRAIELNVETQNHVMRQQMTEASQQWLSESRVECRHLIMTNRLLLEALENMHLGDPVLSYTLCEETECAYHNPVAVGKYRQMMQDKLSSLVEMLDRADEELSKKKPSGLILPERFR